MLSTKWMRPFSTVLTILSVLLQPFAPLIALMPTAKVYAADTLSFSSHLDFKSDSHEFILNQTGVESVQYSLVYERNSSDGVIQEALTGSTSGSNGVVSTSIYAGTCSQNVCVPHEIINGTLEILAKDQQGQMRSMNSTFIMQDGQVWENQAGVWSVGQLQLGKTYTYPNNSGVTLTFTTLPDIAGRISIQELKLSNEKAEELGAISTTAYDITSDMVDGTFSYALTLPITPDAKGLVDGVAPEDLKIAYSENGSDFTGEVEVSSKNTTAVEATSLDHFTVFVLVNPSSNATVGGGSATWSGTGNIYSSDNSRASATFTLFNTVSDTLEAKGYGLSIPSTATIEGIEVGIERSVDVDRLIDAQDSVVRLVKAGTIVGTNKATGTTFTTTDTYQTYGSATDLWGTTWTPADVNNANFGVAFVASRTSLLSQVVRVDHIRVRVYYNTPPTVTVTSPNGAERFAGASIQNITWTAADVDAGAALTVALHYTTDGSVFTPIASGLSNSGTYAWTVPTINAETVRVRATVSDAQTTVSDSSDAVFAIDSTAPSIPTHTSPSNGASVNSSSLIIDWSNVTDLSTPVTYYYQASLSSTTSGPLNSFTSPIYTSSALSTSQIDASGSAENTYYWQVRACDGVGNCSAWSAPWSITVDNTAPTLSESTAVLTPTNDATPDYTFSTSEAGTVAYSGGCSSLTTTAISGSNTITLDTLADGTYTTCQITVTDAAGNTSTPLTLSSFMIDLTLPVISTPVAVQDYLSTYVNGNNFRVRAAVVDPVGGSGVDTSTCEYTIDGSTWNPATYNVLNNRCVAAGLSAADAASLTLNIRVKDLAGNVGTGSALSRTSDANDPVVAAPAITPNISGVTSASPSLASTVSDTVSPIVSCEFRYKKSSDAWILGSGWMSATFSTPTCSASVSGLTDGTSYDFQMRATDTVGNRGRSSSTTITVDDVAPTITVNTTLTNDTTPSLSGTINDSTATISAKVNGTTYLATNNGDGTWTLADNTISPALTEGQYDVLATATDPVGNVGTDATTNELRIDTTKPVITVPSDFSAEATSPAGAYVSYTATALDDVDGALTPTCSPVSGSQFAFGTTTVTCDVTDAAGNDADTATFDITVEDTLDPSATISSPLANSFHNAEFAVSGTATDSGSGVMDPDGIEVEFRKQSDDTLVDSFIAAYTATTSAYTVSILDGVNIVPDGLYKIVVMVEDNASHSASVNVQNVTVDTTAPSSVITNPVNSGDNSTVYTNVWMGLLEGTASDPATGSGVIKRVDLSIQRASDSAYWNGTAWVAGTDATVRVTATGAESWSYTLPSPLEGKYFITTHAVDMADNVENSYHLTIYYDLTLPLVWSTINPVDPDADNDWYQTEPTISLFASDDILLNHIEYQWNGTDGAWTTYTAPFVTFGEGGYTVYYRAFDEAGNISEVGSRLVKFDKTELEHGPLNVSIAPNPTSGETAVVKWDAAKDNVGISGYEIAWKLNGTDTGYMDWVGSDIRQFTITDLTEGVWKVTVRAFDDAGHNKESSIDEIVDRTGPQAPVLRLTGKGTGTVNLAWNSIADAKDYMVVYGVESGKYSYGAHVGNVTTFTVKGLGAGNYYFIVRALDATQNQSPNSNEVSTGAVVGAPGVQPGAPAEGFSPDVLGQTTENADESGSTTQPSVLGAQCNLNWMQRWIPFLFNKNCEFEWLWFLLVLPLGTAGWLYKKKNG